MDICKVCVFSVGRFSNPSHCNSGREGILTTVTTTQLFLMRRKHIVNLVLLTSCDIMGLSSGSVNCDVTSGQPYNWGPPPYFDYSCLSVIPFSIYFGGEEGWPYPYLKARPHLEHWHWKERTLYVPSVLLHLPQAALLLRYIMSNSTTPHPINRVGIVCCIL